MRNVILIYNNDTNELIAGARYVTKENRKEKFKQALALALEKDPMQHEYLVEGYDDNGHAYCLDQFTGEIIEK